jgi:hypothetical protein
VEGGADAVLHGPSFAFEDVVEVSKVAEEIGVVEVMNCAIILTRVRAARSAG